MKDKTKDITLDEFKIELESALETTEDEKKDDNTFEQKADIDFRVASLNYILHLINEWYDSSIEDDG